MAYSRAPAHGGSGGEAFSDDLTEVLRLTGVDIYTGQFVDAIQCVFTTTAEAEVLGKHHGRGFGRPDHISLAEGEVIVEVTGRAGDTIDQIAFRTSTDKVWGPYGGSGGKPFVISDVEVAGFFGRAGDRIDEIGVFVPRAE